MKKDKYLLTPDEAIDLLMPHTSKRKKRIHTLAGNGFALFGCDVDLTTIKKRIKLSQHVCLSGPNMFNMGHGVAYFTDNIGYTFLQTDKDKLRDIHKERKIKLVV